MATVLCKADHINVATPTGKTLVSDLSFSLHTGELLLIQGPNGIGKSTLLRHLMQIAKLRSGKISLHVNANEIGYLPQHHNRNYHIPLTLGDILKFSALESQDFASHVAHIGLLQPEDIGKAWNTASGGERQKTLLTAAFLRNPKLLILDEPMNHLDKYGKLQLMKTLDEFQNRKQAGVLMVCHDYTAHREAPRNQLNLQDFAGV